MKLFALTAALLPFTLVNAATHIISVGEGGALTFTPPQITAVVGDTVAFQFKAKNHSVTQSTFAEPCRQNGVDSGFFPVAAGATEIPQWSFTVNNASVPLWFFCAQNGHCARGMVFAVNPTPERSFEQFQAIANGTATATATGTGTGTGATPSASATGGDGANGALSRSSAGVASAGITVALGVILGVML